MDYGTIFFRQRDEIHSQSFNIFFLSFKYNFSYEYFSQQKSKNLFPPFTYIN